jgi:hypothetical protein
MTLERVRTLLRSYTALYHFLVILRAYHVGFMDPSPLLGITDVTDPTIEILFRVRGNKHQVFPNLIEDELLAIGRVTVSFAYLEHALLIDTLGMVVRHKISPVPEDMVVVSFDRRLTVWKKLVSKYRRGRARAKMLKIATRIRKLQRDRNRITHGLWSWEYESPGRITASTFKPKFEFTEPFDHKKLLAVSDAIGEINFSLTFPRGKAQAWKSMLRNRTKSGAYMSRDFAMVASGKEVPPSIQRKWAGAMPPKPK